MSERVRCRNPRCRSKLDTPTDNEHKAFCTPYCYAQFYTWRCKVCEEPILKGRRRKQPDHCHSAECRRDFRRFPETFTYAKGGNGPNGNYGSGSARKSGVKNVLEDLRAPASARIIAGPPLSDFSLWAATLEPPPGRPMTGWQSSPPPGALAAEWEAREWKRRDDEDAAYVKADEERLRAADLGPLTPEPNPTHVEDDLSIPEFLRRPIGGS